MSNVIVTKQCQSRTGGDGQVCCNLGGIPGLGVIGGDSCSEGCGFESCVLNTGWT